MDHRETSIQSGTCCWSQTSSSQDGVEDSRCSVDLLADSFGGIVCNYMGHNILKNGVIWMGRSTGNGDSICGCAAGREQKREQRFVAAAWRRGEAWRGREDVQGSPFYTRKVS